MIRSSHQSQRGLTLIEVVVALGILTVVALSVAATAASSMKVQTLKREQQLVNEAIFAAIRELRTLTADEIRTRHGSTIALGALAPVTPPATGAPATEGPTFGDAGIVTTSTRLDVVESDPSAPGTPLADSGYFRVTATVSWTGVMGSSSPQTLVVTSQVVSHVQ